MKLHDFLWHFSALQLTEEQMAACRFLESRGLRFCVDFGYENAAAIAEPILARATPKWIV
jgi:hypothetical protein